MALGRGILNSLNSLFIVCSHKFKQTHISECFFRLETVRSLNLSFHFSISHTISGENFSLLYKFFLLASSLICQTSSIIHTIRLVANNVPDVVQARMLKVEMRNCRMCFGRYGLKVFESCQRPTSIMLMSAVRTVQIRKSSQYRSLSRDLRALRLVVL